MPALFKKLSRAANRTKFLPFWSSCFSIFFYSYIRPQTQKLFHPLKIILIKFPKLLKPMVNSIILLRCKKTREARKFEFLHVTKKSQTFWPTHQIRTNTQDLWSFFIIQANNILFSCTQLFHRCSWLSIFYVSKSEPKPFVHSSANSEAKVASGNWQEKACSHAPMPPPSSRASALLPIL